MGVQVPVGFFDNTLVWTHTQSTREFTTSIGTVDTDGGITTAANMAAIVSDAARTGSAGITTSFASAANMVTGWRFERVVSSKMTVDGPLIGIDSTSVIGTNGAINGSPPLNCSLLVSKITPLGGRKNKGRMYMPATYPAESDVSVAGIIGTTFVNNFNLWLTAFRAGCAEQDADLCLFHSDGSAPTVIDALVLSNLLATQRRRMRG